MARSHWNRFKIMTNVLLSAADKNLKRLRYPETEVSFELIIFLTSCDRFRFELTYCGSFSLIFIEN